MTEQSNPSNEVLPPAGKDSSRPIQTAGQIADALAEKVRASTQRPPAEEPGNIPNESQPPTYRGFNWLRRGEFKTQDAFLEAESREREWREFAERFERSGVPIRHARLNTWHGDEWKTEARKLCERDHPYLVAIVGTRGAGKTQMAVEAVRAECKRGAFPKFVDAFDVFLRLRDSYSQRGSGTELEVIQQFLEPNLLVIDGMENRTARDWEARVIDHIANKRYAALKSTILISNETAETFIQTVGPTVSDRLRETGGMIVATWTSFRGRYVSSSMEPETGMTDDTEPF